MSNVRSFIHGIYPRSALLAQTTRDVGRKRKTAVDLKRAEKTDFKNLLALQIQQNFTYMEDGKLHWQDIFRPIITTSNGFATGALTRWFDNNSFFRQPIIDGKLELDTDKLDLYLPTITSSSKWKVTLPSPFMFAKLASSRYELSFAEKLKQTTKIIQMIISYLAKKGSSLVQCNESYIPYHSITRQETALFLQSLKTLKGTAGGAKLAIHFYFGDCAPIARAIHDKGIVDIVGIDFYKTSLSDLPKNMSCGIIAGIVEARNSLIEKEFVLRSFVEKIQKTLKPHTLYLSHNSDLELLPEPVAKEKIILLGRLQKYFQ